MSGNPIILTDLEAAMLGVLSHLYPRRADAMDLYDFLWKGGYIERQLEADKKEVCLATSLCLFTHSLEAICAHGLVEETIDASVPLKEDLMDYRLTLAGTEFVKKCLDVSSKARGKFDPGDLELIQKLAGGRPC